MPDVITITTMSIIHTMDITDTLRGIIALVIIVMSVLTPVRVIPAPAGIPIGDVIT